MTMCDNTQVVHTLCNFPIKRSYNLDSTLVLSQATMYYGKLKSQHFSAKSLKKISYCQIKRQSRIIDCLIENNDNDFNNYSG